MCEFLKCNKKFIKIYNNTVTSFSNFNIKYLFFINYNYIHVFMDDTYIIAIENPMCHQLF